MPPPTRKPSLITESRHCVSVRESAFHPVALTPGAVRLSNCGCGVGGGVESQLRRRDGGTMCVTLSGIVFCWMLDEVGTAVCGNRVINIRALFGIVAVSRRQTFGGFIKLALDCVQCQCL